MTLPGLTGMHLGRVRKWCLVSWNVVPNLGLGRPLQQELGIKPCPRKIKQLQRLTNCLICLIFFYACILKKMHIFVPLKDLCLWRVFHMSVIASLLTSSTFCVLKPKSWACAFSWDTSIHTHEINMYMPVRQDTSARLSVKVSINDSEWTKTQAKHVVICYLWAENILVEDPALYPKKCS